MIGKALYFIEKLYTGSIGNGVSYEQQKARSKSGRDFEHTIELVAKHEGYKVIKNLFIPMGESYTEIDLVLIGRGGVFIVEAKNINATVKGSKEEKQWNLYYNSGKVHTLYNPVMQNNNHVRQLTKHIKYPFISVVVFPDKATLNIAGVTPYQVCTLKDLPRIIKAKGNSCPDREIKDLYKAMKKYQTSNPFTKLKQKRTAIQSKKRQNYKG